MFINRLTRVESNERSNVSQRDELKFEFRLKDACIFDYCSDTFE